MKKNEYINSYCTGCGLCHSVNHAQFKIIDKGFPNVAVKESEDIKFYEQVCPVYYYAEEKKHDVWGEIKAALVGYSSNPDLRFKAASGGALTELCIHLLESKQVDGIIHTTYDSEDQTRTVSCISTTREEVEVRCGSRYSISVPLYELLTMLDSKKKYAFVGKPCDVMALRRYMKLNMNVSNQIYCLLSFFCAGEPSDNAQIELLKSMGCDRADCASITYRGNGWPGYTKVVKKDGTELKLEYKNAWGKYLGRDIRNICRFCMDGTGDAADIVCADFWQLDENGNPDFSEHEGRNIIISRTELGDKILKESVERGNVFIEEDFTSKIDKEFYKYQPAQYKRKGTMNSMISAMHLCGKNTPLYSKEYLRGYASHIDTKTKIKYFVGIIKRVLRGQL